jgi:hypothetical protein
VIVQAGASSAHDLSRDETVIGRDPGCHIQIDYTLPLDPPFTAGITILDAAGDNLTFTAVPEPGSLTIMAAGA